MPEEGDLAEREEVLGGVERVRFDVPPVGRLPRTSRLEEEILKPWEISKVRGQRRALAESSGVKVFLDHGGLGDTIMELRHICAMAKRTQKKRYEVYLPEAVSSIPYLYLPPNCSSKNKIVQEEIRSVFDDKKTFFMALHENISVDNVLVNSIKTYEPDLISEIRKLGDSGYFSDNYRTLPVKGVGRGFGNLVAGAFGVNQFDLVVAARLKLLGVEISERDLSEPILRFPHGILAEYKPGKYDLLIAPDAAEQPSVDGTRSVKSFSPDSWKKILSRVPSGIKIGIVMGVSHSDYTKQVLEKARELGLDVYEVVTPTLTDFCHEVLQAKEFVGMDSGTTHIAYEVANAAKANRKISVNEIFNGSRRDVPPEQYALRGMNDRVRVLSCMPGKFLKSNAPAHYSEEEQDTYRHDIDHINPDLIADYLFTQ